MLTRLSAPLRIPGIPILRLLPHAIRQGLASCWFSTSSCIQSECTSSALLTVSYPLVAIAEEGFVRQRPAKICSYPRVHPCPLPCEVLLRGQLRALERLSSLEGSNITSSVSGATGVAGSEGGGGGATHAYKAQEGLKPQS